MAEQISSTELDKLMADQTPIDELEHMLDVCRMRLIYAGRDKIDQMTFRRSIARLRELRDGRSTWIGFYEDRLRSELDRFLGRYEDQK